MSILFVLVPLGLMLLVAAIAAFFWAVGSGQFDELEGQGTLVLFDDAGRGPRRTTGDVSGREAVASGPMRMPVETATKLRREPSGARP